MVLKNLNQKSWHWIMNIDFTVTAEGLRPPGNRTTMVSIGRTSNRQGAGDVAVLSVCQPFYGRVQLRITFPEACHLIGGRTSVRPYMY